VSLQEYIRGGLKDKKILLMTHVIAGYPSLQANWRMLEIMAEVGVDMVELQMPFSEPVADGPTFALANQKALERGISLDQYFDLMQRSTARFDFPHLMMGYYNVVFRLGHQAFCRRLKGAGGAGYILPDLPIEEYGDLVKLSDEHQLEPVMLMTPTNTTARLQAIGLQARGLVYGVARKGVTGSRTDIQQQLYELIERWRQATPLPLALGFGLRQGEDLRRLQGKVEMGIVGSALLDTWEKHGETGYRALLEDLATSRY
jgi:tryptophan synthase alpha chain